MFPNRKNILLSSPSIPLLFAICINFLLIIGEILIKDFIFRVENNLEMDNFSGDI